MNSENLLKPIQQLLIQVQDLLALAHAQEWDAIQAQMADYQQAATLLDDLHFLQTLKDAGLAMEAQDLILQIQDVNQQVDQQAVLMHDKILSELRQMIQSDKAMDAYGR